MLVIKLSNWAYVFFNVYSRTQLSNNSSFFSLEIAEFFFVDTTPFVEKYWTDPKDHTYDWREVAPRKNYMETVLKVLSLSLLKVLSLSLMQVQTFSLNYNQIHLLES